LETKTDKQIRWKKRQSNRQTDKGEFIETTTYRQTDRQIDKGEFNWKQQTNRQTRQIYEQTDRPTDRRTDRQRWISFETTPEKQTDKHKNKQTYKQTDKGEFHLKQQQFHDAYSGDAPSHAITH
jgi:hypothetical protein